MKNNAEEIRNIADEIVKILIDRKVSYADAREILMAVSKKIERVEINSDSLRAS